MSRNWSSAYSFAEGTNWSDADTTQRVYEYAVEPVTLQHLPDHALLLIETRTEGGRKLTPVECDPAIVTLNRVATTPLPDPPPRRPQQRQVPPMQKPAAQAPPIQAPPGQGAVPYPPQWAAPPPVEPPRTQLPYAPGPPPGYQTGPRPAPQQEEPKNEAQEWRPGQIWSRTPPKNPPRQDPPPRRAPRPKPDDDDDRPGPPPLFGRAPVRSRRGPMSPVFGVDEAVALARWAHAGQTDKAGRSYIEHPLRVMHRLHGEHEQMAAILHDVLEDTSTTEDDLRTAGCSELVIAAVLALTKQPGEPLDDSMARAAANPIACAVKRADIADNSDPDRLALLDEATAQRLCGKYAESIRLLDRYASDASGSTDGC